ncbi:MAG TPA: fibronectin type III domain-containing protein [Xanthomonadaceae bacterium]|jgi:hypothetical protein|nr:fibronectin type III domain-containing protein [Xanthomonadaceae bacterium]
MNAKVSIAFLGASSDANLVILTGHIVEAMTGNATYPSPVPTLAAIATARDSYVSAVHALDRSRASVVLRDSTRAALVQMLRDLALYVQHTCQGDMGKLLTSGFPAQKKRGHPVGVLLAPQNVRLRRGLVTGQLLARCKAERSASSYQWRYATALAPTAWTQADAVTTASFTLNGLARGTDYIVQVRAIGAAGSSDWSSAATVMAV